MVRIINSQNCSFTLGFNKIRDTASIWIRVAKYWVYVAEYWVYAAKYWVSVEQYLVHVSMYWDNDEK